MGVPAPSYQTWGYLLRPTKHGGACSALLNMGVPAPIAPPSFYSSEKCGDVFCFFTRQLHGSTCTASILSLNMFFYIFYYRYGISRLNQYFARKDELLSY